MQRVLVFQYNPETLVRRLDAAPATTSGTGVGSVAALASAAALPAQSAPLEFASFTLSLDAADKLETGDTLTQQSGLLPAISALELLLYSPASTITVWVSGNKRIVPVRITEMQIAEQAFDPALNPIRAAVSVSLQVLKDADFPANSRGRALWDAHYATLQQLAQSLANGTLGTLGLTAI